ncbi:uncharacterized protein LOC143535383 [Bidens hawaiensis]|uniref:uncharacterized protein LOC143535383 n=1 Tax=Bidens hawaiensis TaxID=980011 RepID=UPI0040499F8B
MTTNEFSKSVNIGLKLSQRIYYGKHGPPMRPPKPPSMTKCPTLQSQLSSTSSFRMPDKHHHPTAPMVYAMISDPDIVDNPDIRSYQPHMYGRCNPPALIPLHMHEVSMNVDCCLDTAFVILTGVWRMHCVTASACCDCRIAIPMSEQGLLLDVDVETAKRSYFTKLVMPPNDEKDSDRVAKAKDGFMMKRNTYTLKIPQRDMFCFYLFPGTNKDNKVFRKEMIFLLDISGSMRDTPLEQSKYAIAASLSKLNHEDSFNIIAFNEDTQSFSSSLELATEETITNATEWMWENLVADGGTNLMSPLKQALDMVGKTDESIPLIFLVTDGSVEDEKDICSYCNQYFLQTLAHLGRGYYDAARDVDSVGDRMERLLDKAMSPMLANVILDALQNLESYELYPSGIPDLLSESPLIVTGRYQGKFPEFVKASGLRADLNTCVIDVKVRNITDIHLEKVCARIEVDILTAHAWLEQNTHMEDKEKKSDDRLAQYDIMTWPG